MKCSVHLVLCIVIFASCHVSGQIFTAGVDLNLEPASEMKKVAGHGLVFESTGHDPYTQTMQFPTSKACRDIQAIVITLNRPKPVGGEVVELFLELNNGKGITGQQSMSLPLHAGKNRYLFDMRKNSWFKGSLLGFRLDPCGAPGIVEIYSVELLKNFPTATEGYVTASNAGEYQSNFKSGSDSWTLPMRVGPDGPCLVYETKEHSFGNYASLTRRIPAVSGEVLNYSAKVNISKPLKFGGCAVAALFFDKNGNHVGSAESEQIAQTGGWQKSDVTFRVPENIVALELRVTNSGEGRVEIKDIELKPANKFERMRIPNYAGTLDEQKLLNSWAMRFAGVPMPSVSLYYKDLPDVAKYSVNVFWENAKHPDGNFDLNGTDPSHTYSKANRLIKEIRFWLRADYLEGDLSLSINLVEDGGGWESASNKWYSKAIVLKDYAGKWKEVVLTQKNFMPTAGNWGDKPDWAKVGKSAGLNVHVGTGKGRVLLRLADVKIEYTDNTIANIFTVWKDPYCYYPKLDKPLAAGPYSQFRIMQGGGAPFVETPAGKKYLTEIKKVLPNFGIQSNLCLSSLLLHHDWFKKNNIALGFQNIGPFLWQAAVEHDALMTKRDDYKLDTILDPYHKIDQTSPAWKKIFGEVASRFKDYGIKEYQVIDGHFNFTGDYNKYRPGFCNMLNEKDNGVRLYDGQRLRFWDYFKEYTGFKWKPGNLGWKTWNDYGRTTCNPFAASAMQRKRMYLDMMLRHYAYFLFQSEVGAIFQQYGIKYFLMNNGDDWMNGNDWYFNSACPDIGGFVEETYFYHPSTVAKAEPLGPVFRYRYGLSGTHHRLIAETGLGGHGRPYWAPEVAYAIMYSVCSAKRYDSLEVDWQDECDWDTSTNPDNHYHNARWCDYITKSLAYNHATLDEQPALGNKTGLIASVAESSGIVAGGMEERQLASLLEEENLPIAYMFPPDIGTKILNDTKVLVLDCYALPEGKAAEIIKWVKASPERAVVLYGPNAARRVNGTMWSRPFGWDRKCINAPKQFEELFGKVSVKNSSMLGDVRYYPSREEGSVLLKDESGPVLSVYKTDNGGRVYFYHRIPRTDEKIDSKVIDAIAKAEGVARKFDEQIGHAVVNRYDYKDGTIGFALFNRDLMKAYRFDPHTGNEPYMWKAANAEIKGVAHNVKPGKYILFEFLQGKESPVTVGNNGDLTLDMKGVSAEVFYLIPDDDTDRLEKVHKQRAEVFRWLDKRKASLEDIKDIEHK